MFLGLGKKIQAGRAILGKEVWIGIMTNAARGGAVEVLTVLLSDSRILRRDLVVPCYCMSTNLLSINVFRNSSMVPLDDSVRVIFLVCGLVHIII